MADGKYQIYNKEYDVDPAWSNILYQPLKLGDVNEGFVYTPSSFNSTTPAPEPTTTQPSNAGGGGYISSGGEGWNPGGDDGKVQSGVGNTDYNDKSFWGGTFNPNPVSIGKALKDFAPTMASFMQNPVRTTLSGLTKDPINDKAFQSQLSSYLAEVAPDITVKDFVSAYKNQTKSNFNSKVNAIGTIQGMALGLDPEYSDAYATMMEQGRNPHDFARAYNEAMGLGMTPDTLDSTINNAYQNYGAVYNPLGVVRGVHQGGFTSIADLNNAVSNRQAFQDRLDSVVRDYGFKDFNEAMGGSSSGGGGGGIGGGYGTGDSGGIGGIGSEGNVGGSSYGTPGTDSAFGGGYDQGGYSGGRDGMAGYGGEGGGGYGGGDSGTASGGDPDGDSSNNGNGAHE